jgi:SPP1 gp7 family putative phage head morphogenesis protein
MSATAALLTELDVFLVKAARILDDGDDAARLELEARGQRRILIALRKQLRAAVPAGITEDALRETGGAAAAVERAMAETPALRDALFATLVDGALLGVTAGRQDTERAMGVSKQIGIDWALVNAEAREWASSYSYELVHGIDETTRRVLQHAISEWIDNSLSWSQLLHQIGDSFGADRAEAIASTEITRSYAQAKLLALQRGGVIQFVGWRTATDERVCPRCGPMNGQTAPVEIGFDGPPLHPRCRCWLVGEP